MLLRWLGDIPQSRRSLVQFPVRHMSRLQVWSWAPALTGSQNGDPSVCTVKPTLLSTPVRAWLGIFFYLKNTPCDYYGFWVCTAHHVDPLGSSGFVCSPLFVHNIADIWFDWSHCPEWLCRALWEEGLTMLGEQSVRCWNTALLMSHRLPLWKDKASTVCYCGTVCQAGLWPC